MTAYYNEIDPYAAAWLRELIKNGHIAAGDVDERSICEVAPGDLDGYAQCHFFAGIGGWSRALRLAGWPDDRPVWTGSCPCQPFSTAGKGLGTKDKRHLWPEFRRLIAERCPSICFGEQVAGAAGRTWLGSVRTDLEDLGYAVGAADLCAAGVGAPHIRQRMYWVANLPRNGRGEWNALLGGRDQGGNEDRKPRSADGSGACGAEANHPGWNHADRLGFRDRRWRPVEPGSQPLAHGVPSRVGLLRGYGNAIVPQVATAFIGACLDVIDSALEQG